MRTCGAGRGSRGPARVGIAYHDHLFDIGQACTGSLPYAIFENVPYLAGDLLLLEHQRI